VHYLQVPSIDITSAEPISVNVDGESSDAGRLQYEARRGDLRIHLPHLPGEGD
jgi:diacylglycerol kinase family enzyme